MATRRWRGDAPAVQQITTLTPANVEVGDVFTVTINGKSVSYTAEAATVADVTAGLAQEINESDIPEFDEIEASDQTTYINLIGITEGVPFTISTGTTNGGAANTQTLTANTITAATGPNHWDDADNWTGAAVPVNGDDVVIDSGSSDILYGLAQSAVTLTSLTATQEYTGKIGLPLTNNSSSGPYAEYRDTYLAIGATTISIGGGTGNGSDRIKINTGSAQTTLNISNSGQEAFDGAPVILWKGTHASNVVNITKGSIGIAYVAGETATVATLRVGFRESVSSDAKVRCGSGVTLTNIEQSGGNLTIDSNTTSIVQGDGTLTIKSGAHTSIVIDGGTCYYNSAGTLTTALIGGGGALDFQQDMRTKTVTNCTVNANSTLRDPFKRVTFTNGVDLNRCKIAEVPGLDLGDHFTISLSAI